MRYSAVTNIVMKFRKEEEKINNSRKRKNELYQNKEWYTIRSLLGNQWAN